MKTLLAIVLIIISLLAVIISIILVKYKDEIWDEIYKRLK